MITTNTQSQEMWISYYLITRQDIYSKIDDKEGGGGVLIQTRNQGNTVTTVKLYGFWIHKYFL